MKKLLRVMIPLILLASAFGGGYLMGKRCGHARAFRFEDRAEFRARMLDKMDQKLDLNAEQRKQVELILEEKGKQFELLKEELKPRFKALHEESAERINKILDENQQIKFNKFREKIKKRHHSN